MNYVQYDWGMFVITISYVHYDCHLCSLWLSAILVMTYLCPWISTSVTQTQMVSLSNNALVSPYEESGPQVRSTNSSLQFCWPGVADPTVSHFHFRFLHESRPLTGWSPLDVHETCGVLEKQGQRLPAGTVTAQMRASNARLMTSDVVTAVVRLDDTKPVLTGKRFTYV